MTVRCREESLSAVHMKVYYANLQCIGKKKSDITLILWDLSG